jgi:superoxide dismutase
MKNLSRTTLLAFAGEAQPPEPALRLDPLPYAYEALEPQIDAQTMEIHYSRHHQGYFNNLLEAVEGMDLAGKTVEEILGLDV